jgi:hypothetical protein
MFFVAAALWELFGITRLEDVNVLPGADSAGQQAIDDSSR